MSVPVDIRLTDVAPPEEEPHRTIYSDLPNLPDPIYLGVTVRIFNDDAVPLYMRVDGSGTGWTFTSNDLGSVAAGSNIYKNLDNFGNRAKPGAALEQDVTIRLRAYTDAGYSNLKWTKERTVTLVFIKSDDGSWTQDVLNNFDDGTVQGWAAANVWQNYAGYPIVAVNTDYYLSANYSLRMTSYQVYSSAEVESRLYKQFTTPDKAQVFAIANLRPWDSNPAQSHHKSLRVLLGSVVHIWLGRDPATTTVDDIPTAKWIRLVFPLPKNTTVTINFHHRGYGGAGPPAFYLNLDDFRIISKD